MADTATTDTAAQGVSLQPLEVLYESRALPLDLPHQLRALYGGSLGITPGLYANFVTTIDGAVALPRIADSNKIISAGSKADRFVMGLLRASADVVLLGSGTLRASPRDAREASAA